MSFWGFIFIAWIISTIFGSAKKKNRLQEKKRPESVPQWHPSGELADARQSLYALAQAKDTLESDALKRPVDAIIRLSERVLYTAEREPAHRGKTLTYLTNFLPRFAALVASAQNRGVSAFASGAKQLGELAVQLERQVNAFYSGRTMDLGKCEQLLTDMGRRVPRIAHEQAREIDLAGARKHVDKLEACFKELFAAPIARSLRDIAALSRYLVDTCEQYPEVRGKCEAFFHEYLPTLVIAVSRIADSDRSFDVGSLAEAFSRLDTRLRGKIEAMRGGTPLDLGPDVVILQSVLAKTAGAPKPDAPAQSAEPETAKTRLSRAGALHERLIEIGERIKKTEIRAPLLEIIHICERALQTAEREDRGYARVTDFFEQYIPALLALLDRYGLIEMSGLPNDGFLTQVERLMGRLSAGFSAYMQALYAGGALDVARDVRLIRAAIAGQNPDSMADMLRETSSIATGAARDSLAAIRKSAQNIQKRRLREVVGDLVSLCERSITMVERSPDLFDKSSEFFTAYIPKLSALVTRYEIFQDRRSNQPMGRFRLDAEDALFTLQRSYATNTRTESGLPDCPGDVTLMDSVLSGSAVPDSSVACTLFNRRRATARAVRTLLPALGIGALTMAGAALWSGMTLIVDAGAALLAAGCTFITARMVTAPNAATMISADPEGHSEELAQATVTLNRLAGYVSVIDNAAITNPLRNIVSTCGSILDTLDKRPEKFASARGFLERYLPTLISILDRYNVMEDKGLTPEDSAFRAQVEAFMPEFERAFAKQLHSLYEDDVLDASLDIDVLQSTLRAEGLIDVFGAPKASKGSK